MKTLTLASGLTLGLACSSTGSTLNEDPERYQDSALDTGSGEAGDTAETSFSGASWFGLEGSLVFEEQRTTASLTVHFYAEDDTTTPLCSADTDTVQLIGFDITPDPTVHYWANTRALQTLADSPCLDSDRLPDGDIQLGIGELHSSLLPIMESKGLGDIAGDSTTRGGYIGFNQSAPSEQAPGTALVLGYATADTDEANEMPDNSQATNLFGLFLFPLEDLETDTGGD